MWPLRAAAIGSAGVSALLAGNHEARVDVAESAVVVPRVPEAERKRLRNMNRTPSAPRTSPMAIAIGEPACAVSAGLLSGNAGHLHQPEAAAAAAAAARQGCSHRPARARRLLRCAGIPTRARHDHMRPVQPSLSRQACCDVLVSPGQGQTSFAGSTLLKMLVPVGSRRSTVSAWLSGSMLTSPKNW